MKMKAEEYKQIVYGIIVALVATFGGIVGQRQNIQPMYLIVGMFLIMLIGLFILKYNQINENTELIHKLEDRFKLNEELKNIYTKLAENSEAIKWHKL